MSLWLCGEDLVEALELEVETKKNLSHTIKKWQSENYFENDRPIGASKKRYGRELFRTSRRTSDSTKYRGQEKELNDNMAKLPLLPNLSDLVLVTHPDENANTKEQLKLMAKSASLFTKGTGRNNIKRSSLDNEASTVAVNRVQLAHYFYLPKLTNPSPHNDYNQSQKSPRKEKTCLTARLHPNKHFRKYKNKSKIKINKTNTLDAIKEVPETQSEEEYNRLPVINCS